MDEEFLDENSEASGEREQPEKGNQELENSSSLTPWQSEHQEFMNAQGEKTSWQLEQEEAENKKLENQSLAEVSDENLEELHYESFQEKLPKLKKQRNHKLIRQVSLIFGIFFIALLFMLYFISPFSKLEKITISGNEFLSSKEILKVSHLVKGQGLWSQYFSKGGIEEEIQKMSPRVESVQMKLSGFNSVEIRVNEYGEVAYEEDIQTKKLHPVLSTGALMKESLNPTDKKLLILRNFKGNKKQVSAVIEQYNRLENSLRDQIVAVTLTPTATNPDLAVLSMKDGNEVKISFEDINERLISYPKIAKNMPESGVVDMEMGIYSYPFSKKEEEEKRGKDSDKPKDSSSDKEDGGEEI